MSASSTALFIRLSTSAKSALERLRTAFAALSTWHRRNTQKPEEVTARMRSNVELLTP